jgi:Telomeric repeat-binding factor 2.
MPFRLSKPRVSAMLALLVTATAVSPLFGAQAKPQKPVKPIPGGANQVEGLNGKVGQMLFTGKWRFQVLSAEPVETYALKAPGSEQDYAKYHDVAEYDDASRTFTPKAGYTFVAVRCKAKNGQKKVQQLDFYLNDQKTALADEQGNSHPPIAFDMQSKGAWVTKPLLPGSEVDITVLFAVPPDTKLKDVVFTLKNWEDRVGKEVRVSLKAPAPKSG